MNFRFPPSSALSCITAWAVVALPEKKSRIRESLFAPTVENNLTKSTGFGKEKILFSNKFCTSAVPLRLETLFSKSKERIVFLSPLYF